MCLFKPNIKRLTEKKNVPGLIEAAEWGLKHKDIKTCLRAITVLGEIRDPHAVYPLLQMAEKADNYFPEQCHPIIAAIFRAIGKIEALQSYIPLVRLFTRLQTRPSTFIPDQRTDQRYAAFLFAIQSLNHQEDRNLADVLFQEILQPKKVVPKEKDDKSDSRETRRAALEVLNDIGNEQDVMRLEQIIGNDFSANTDKDMENAYKTTIDQIKKRLTANEK